MSRKTGILPKTVIDGSAFLFLLSTLGIITWFEIIIIFQFHSGPMSWKCVLILVFSYILCNIIVNLIHLLSTDVSSGSQVLPSVLKPGWRYCFTCEYNAPPRSFHCHICNVCVLRREHHCMFTGCCIGYANYRFYIWMVFYLFWGTLFVNVLNWKYIWEIIGGVTMKNLVIMVLPFFTLMLGISDIYTTLVAFINAICSVGMFFLLALLAYHGTLIKNGQTSYERSHSILEYDLGLWANVEDILGKKWYLECFFPFLLTDLQGDGVHFRKKCAVRKVIKNN